MQRKPLYVGALMWSAVIAVAGSAWAESDWESFPTQTVEAKPVFDWEYKALHGRIAEFVLRNINVSTLDGELPILPCMPFDVSVLYAVEENAEAVDRKMTMALTKPFGTETLPFPLMLDKRRIFNAALGDALRG